MFRAMLPYILSKIEAPLMTARTKSCFSTYDQNFAFTAKLRFHASITV